MMDLVPDGYIKILLKEREMGNNSSAYLSHDLAKEKLYKKLVLLRMANEPGLESY